MKKSFLLILCLLLAIALVACDAMDDNENEDTTAGTTAEVTTTAEETTEAEETTAEVTTAETTSGDETTTTEETTTGYIQQHEHTFSDEWSADDDNHWHAATCEHVGEKSDLGAHADANNDDECDVCAYDLTCEHELSNEIVGIAAGHYHLTDCEHDLILDLTAHTGTEDGICDVCEFTFADFIDEITAPDAANRVSNGTMSYVGQYETREVSFKLGLGGFLFIDENVSYGPENVTNTKHSIHLFNNNSVLYIKASGEEVYREEYNVTPENVKGYKYSSDMFNYLSLGSVDPCGTENLLYALYEYVTTNLTSNYSFTWGETSNITFAIGSEYSATVYSVDFTISANGVITSLVASTKTYYAPDEGAEAKYSIDADGIITVVEGAETDSSSVITIAQQEGSREDIKSEYNLDEIVITDYALKMDGADIGDTVNVEVGTPAAIIVEAIAPETANLDLDRLNFLVIDETGSETYNANAYMFGNEISISTSKPGNYVVTITTLATTKTITVVATAPATTSLSAASVDTWGNKEAFTSKDLYAGVNFEFAAEAQSSYADASFTAVLADGTTGATLTVSEESGNYVFSATVPGTYTVTLTSTSNPAVSCTATFNVTEAPDVKEYLNGKWEGSNDWGESATAEFMPDSATTGTYTLTFGGTTWQYRYELNGTTLTSEMIAGDDWMPLFLAIDSNLKLVATDDSGWTTITLTQKSSGGSDTENHVFDGTYSGVLDGYMGLPATITTTGPDSFILNLDGMEYTYYYSVGENGYFSVVCMGTKPDETFKFRYIPEMDLVTMEMTHPMTQMDMEIGALAKVAAQDNTVEGTYAGEVTQYYGSFFELVFNADGTVVITEKNNGDTLTMSYVVGENGILELTLISGEAWVIDGLQFAYISSVDVVEVYMFSNMTGTYNYVTDLTKKEESTGVNIEGIWKSADGRYSVTFWGDASGQVDFMKADGSWEKTRGFTWEIDENGVITFTLGKLGGYGTWNGAQSTYVDGVINLVLDDGSVELAFQG